MKIRKYETRNKQTGLEFLECITSDGGTKGVTAIYGRLAGLEDERGQAPSISKITDLPNFAFHNNYIQAWRAYSIGTGIQIKKQAYEGKHNTVTFTAIKTIHKGEEEMERPQNTAEYWKQIQKLEQNSAGTCETGDVQEMQQSLEEVPESPEIFDLLPYSDEDEGEAEIADEAETEPPPTEPEGDNAEQEEQLEIEQADKLYPCPVDGCVKEYQTYAALEKHMLMGNHKYEPTQISLRDTIIGSYSRNLENQFVNGIFKEVNDDVVAINVATEDDVLPQGWALRSRKPTTQFTLKQVQYLTTIFNEGERPGHAKMDGATTAKMMRVALNPDGTKMFGEEEWLKAQQIASWFSREKTRYVFVRCFYTLRNTFHSFQKKGRSSNPQAAAETATS